MKNTMTTVTRRNLLRAGIVAGVGGTIGTTAAAMRNMGFPYISKHSREHIILIIADAMRGDKIGKVVNGMEVTPNLNRLAQEEVCFSHAYSECSWTKPSMASILTGQYPQYHGVEGGALTIPEIPTIASFLKGKGYATFAIQTNPWLARNKPKSEKPEDKSARHTWGFGAYFDLYLYRYTGGLSKRKDTMNSAYAYADNVRRHFVNIAPQLEADAPLFTYLHFMDTHEPWLLECPTEFTGRFHEDGLLETHDAAEIYRNDLEVVKKLVFDHAEPTEEDKLTIAAVNDEAAANLDNEIGKLLSWLKATGQYDNETLILTADHGDELYDKE